MPPPILVSPPVPLSTPPNTPFTPLVSISELFVRIIGTVVVSVLPVTFSVPPER